MTRTFFAGLSAVAALASTTALAQEVEYRAIEAKNLASGKHAIDPAKAYILISAPTRTQGIFIKTPDAAELAEYSAEYEKELAEAIEKYPRRLKNWQANQAANRQGSDQPIEPTRENFAFPALEPRMLVSFGPTFVFEKGDKDQAGQNFSYLVEVEPGDYTYYGPLYYQPGTAVAGTCYCMGTIQFAAAQGQITNLGDFLTMRWADDAALSKASHLPPEGDRTVVPVSYPVPTALSGQKVVPAELRAAGKINNFLNIMIGRIPPVPGVLDYDRDRILDLRATDAATGAGE